jgi:hypothetical protein
MQWLDDNGYKWEKICAEPGDLILWDSRTPHYNLTPTGTTPRFCVYTCYLPVADITQEDLLRKKRAFESTYKSIPCFTHSLVVAKCCDCPYTVPEADFSPQACQSTTHWPNAVQENKFPLQRDGADDPLNFRIPKSGTPQLSERAFKLTGIPYIKTEA